MKMRGQAAFLLAIVLCTTVVFARSTTEGISTSSTSARYEATTAASNKFSTTGAPASRKNSTNLKELPVYPEPFINPKEILLQEIRTLDEQTSNAKIQEEVAKAFKAGAEKGKFQMKSTTPRATPTPTPTAGLIKSHPSTTENQAMKELVESEDVSYNEDLDDDEDEENEDSEYDEDDDDDEDEEDEDNIEDEEDVMTQCPDYCRCSGQYAATTAATCSKFVNEQAFGPGIAHLKIANSPGIQLGPHSFRERELQQLESVTIEYTKIFKLDRTAFDGLPYLFAVNLTRNGLMEIHSGTFQNNTQLSLLTISGQVFLNWQNSEIMQDYLLDAPSVAELDFSSNTLLRLPRNAFTKVPNLVYLSLKNNGLHRIENGTFQTLDSLEELDLSHNRLSDLPMDIFKDKGLQILRISDNNFTTLSVIRASKLTQLNASNNKIKVITKEDLLDVPSLDQLTLRSNGLKRIHQHAFSTLDELTHLDLSDNKLTLLTEHHLRANPRLQILLMNDNPGLKTLPVFKIGGIESLEYETYSVWRFECANCGLESLQEGTFNAMPAITRLNLARNRLSKLPRGLLEPLSTLRELDLSNNLFTNLEPSMFRGATSLSKLSLSGNPLVTLQVSPFLMTPGLTSLDVSSCALERVWSEARVPLKSLRFLSVRGNQLQRITVEELKATPKLSGLDLSHNPLTCDDDFNEAIQWLIDHGVTPTETLRYISNFGNADDYSEAEGVLQWIDLVKIYCHNLSDGPPPRPRPHKTVESSDILPPFDILEGNSRVGQEADQQLDDAWDHIVALHNQEEYVDLPPYEHTEPPSYEHVLLWPIVACSLIILALLLLGAHFALIMAKRRGRGPVIRPPMILRQGLVDNKNCGLVYKPLHEEIPTPHMPKRGSFYSSSTFHYDKIVPESV